MEKESSRQRAASAEPWVWNRTEFGWSCNCVVIRVEVRGWQWGLKAMVKTLDIS